MLVYEQMKKFSSHAGQPGPHHFTGGVRSRKHDRGHDRRDAYRKTFHESEMTHSLVCMPSCVQKELDGADTIRDAMFQQLTPVPSLRRIRWSPSATVGHQV